MKPTPTDTKREAVVKPKTGKPLDKRASARQEHSHFTNRADNRSE